MISRSHPLQPATNKAESTDVVHLTFKPPFVPGSFNRAIGVQMERITEISQRAISFWNGPLPAADALGAAHTILARSEDLSWRQKLLFRFPYRARRHLAGIGATEWLTYVWRMIPVLASLKPKVVV